MEKPSLHELANSVGFGSGLKGIRKHYDPLWGTTAGDVKRYHVTVEYSYTETDYQTYDVEAIDESAAKRVAREMFDEDPVFRRDDYEIESVEVEEADDA